MNNHFYKTEIFMKKLLFGFTLLSSISVNAEGIRCSKSLLGATYRATVTFLEGGASISISTSNNRATRNGRHSEGPVAYQEFGAISQQSINNVNVIAMDLFVSDPHTGEPQLSYAEINQSGTEHSLLVKGKTLPLLNRIKFQDCNIIVE